MTSVIQIQDLPSTIAITPAVTARLHKEATERDQFLRNFQRECEEKRKPKTDEKKKSPPSLLEEAQKLAKALHRDEVTRGTQTTKAFKSVDQIWLDFKLLSSKDRAWQSLNCWRALFLYGISMREIARASKVAYRTVQYFFHAPSKVGYRSALRITIGTKLVMARRILWYEEPYEITWERWHNCDPRQIPHNFLRTLKRGKCDTLRD